MGTTITVSTSLSEQLPMVEQAIASFQGAIRYFRVVQSDEARGALYTTGEPVARLLRHSDAPRVRLASGVTVKEAGERLFVEIGDYLIQLMDEGRRRFGPTAARQLEAALGMVAEALGLETVDREYLRSLSGRHVPAKR